MIGDAQKRAETIRRKRFLKPRKKPTALRTKMKRN